MPVIADDKLGPDKNCQLGGGVKTKTFKRLI